MLSLLSCCIIPRQSPEVNILAEAVTFERYTTKNISTRSSKQKHKSPKKVTGMAKFRLSQKMKRKAAEEHKNRLERMKKSTSQPSVRIRNFKPYDC